MALRKPSDLFHKKETFGVFEAPEVSSDITESYDKFLNNFNKVNELSEKVEFLSQELSEKLTKTELENAMLSQLMVLDENFKSLQNQVKGLNKQDLKEFKETVVSLSEIVNNLVETELPKYKKQVTKNELYVGEQVNQLQEVVESNISGIREEIGEKFENIADVVDNNINYFDQKLEETSSQVKKTTDTYAKISNVLENKVLKENQKFEEYSELIENLSQAFGNLSGALKEELNVSSQLTEEKFEEYKKQFENISTELETFVDVRLEDYHKEILDIKADVVINEQHIKSVDKYIQEHHQELVELKEEVFIEIKKLPVGNFQENLERLEKKIDYIKETYSKIEPEVIVKEVIKEGLLNEPPNTKNSDPLTPLDQKFVTLTQLQEHYRLFINRIQQQLSTLGGGGETRLKYLDDIVGIATNASAYDGKYLKYNHSLGQFEFADVDISNDSWVDGALGPYTLGSVGIGTTNAITQLHLSGFSTTNSNLKIGSLEFQNYSLNNSFFGDNVYWNGSAMVRRSTGAAGLFYFYGNEGQFRLSPVGSEGSETTNNPQLKINSNGGFGVGSSLSQGLNDFTGSNFYVNPQGIVLVGTISSTGTASQRLQVNGGTYVSGSVGIGTINPTSKLHVVGDGNFTGVVTATTFIGALTGTATSTTNIPNLTGDISSVNTSTTLATVNSNVGTFGGTGAIPVVTVNGKGLVTGVTTVTASLTGTATSTTNIPNLTGAITSNNTTTSLGSFTSAQLATALTDETGSGSAVFATSPTLVTPSLGAASATSIVVSSGSTFTNGPILVGTATSTGTASQPLQVTGGAYVSGSVGIGTTNPTQKLHVVGNVRITGGIYDSNNNVGSASSVLTSTGSGISWATASGGGATLTNDTTTNATYYPTFSSATSGTYSTAYVSNTKCTFNPSTGTLSATVFTSLSDEKLKTNIQPISDPLEKVAQIQGVSFNWIENNNPSMGVIANELQKVLPELVSDTDPKTVNYNGLIGLLIEVVKEQQEKIQLAEQKISRINEILKLSDIN